MLSLASNISGLNVAAVLLVNIETDFLLFFFLFFLFNGKEELRQLYPFCTVHPSHAGIFKKISSKSFISSSPINLHNVILVLFCESPIISTIRMKLN